MGRFSWLAFFLMAALLGGGSRGANGSAPEIIPGGQWFNSKPVTLAGLRGKVVLVNIWVHSCINCHNSLPTLKKWYAAYKSQGLEIIGVHTPETKWDRDPSSLKQSLRDDGVTWPVVQDNDSATWRAYNNQFWPAFYLVDRRGVIRMTHAGEISTRYPDAIPGLEATLKALLAETASR
jgi:thiol-disulfide isomerase/thioredoxin